MYLVFIHCENHVELMFKTAAFLLMKYHSKIGNICFSDFNDEKILFHQ